MTGWTPLGLLVVAYGLAYLAGEASIFTFVRLRLLSRLRSQWAVALIYCPACLGWWTGVVTAIGAMALGVVGDWQAVAWLPFASMVAGQVRSFYPPGEARDIELGAFDLMNPWLSQQVTEPSGGEDEAAETVRPGGRPESTPD